MLPSSGKICEFSHVTNSHIFPDEGSIAERLDFYSQLSAFNLPPSYFQHTQMLQREKVIETKILKPSTQLSLALEKHLRLPAPLPPQQIWIQKRKAFFVFSLDEEDSQ